jgi:hypothetical protein
MLFVRELCPAVPPTSQRAVIDRLELGEGLLIDKFNIIKNMP